MISSKDLVTLLSLLSEEEKPFETISTTFYRTFNKNEQFKVGCAIYTITSENVDQTNNNNPSSSSSTSTSQLLDYPIAFNPFLPIFIEDTEQQQQQQQQQQPQDLNKKKTTTSTTNEDIKITTEELSLFSFEPSYQRIPPPFYFPVNTMWVDTSIIHGLLLSPMVNGLSIPINPKKIVRDLMSKAIRGRLKRPQLQQIKVEMDQDPKLVLYSGLTPKKLPNLVENNTQVAIESLLKLIHSINFKEYFQALVSMEMNYRSMEVVNALATSVELPSHFIPMYISNCIQTCNNIKDKAMQQRSVRLVCVFIQSLIRNNIIDIRDLFTEVQSFCLEYSKIREAISLFKLMTEENNIQTAVTDQQHQKPTPNSQ
eukprot:gene7528-9251_t